MEQRRGEPQGADAARTIRASSSSVGTPGRNITSLAPLSSAPHSSKVEASKDSGETCSNVSFGPSAAKFVFFTSRTTLRCSTQTPFGVPVEPEVYIT